MCLQRAGLVALQALWLEDNPLACAPAYRVDVLACFLAPGGLRLDGKAPARADLEAARLRGPVRPALGARCPVLSQGLWCFHGHNPKQPLSCHVNPNACSKVL